MIGRCLETPSLCNGAPYYISLCHFHNLRFERRRRRRRRRKNVFFRRARVFLTAASRGPRGGKHASAMFPSPSSFSPSLPLATRPRLSDYRFRPCSKVGLQCGGWTTETFKSILTFESDLYFSTIALNCYKTNINSEWLYVGTYS